MNSVYILNIDSIIEEIIADCSDVSRTRSGAPRNGESEDYIKGKKDAITQATELLSYLILKGEISPEALKNCLEDKNTLTEWKESWV